MKHVSITVPHGQSACSTLACITGACEVFSTANAFRNQRGRKELFRIELAGTAKKRR